MKVSNVLNYYDGNLGTNESGFNGYPSYYSYSAGYDGKYYWKVISWWSSTYIDSNSGYYYRALGPPDGIYRGKSEESSPYYIYRKKNFIRLVKNN